MDNTVIMNEREICKKLKELIKEFLLGKNVWKKQMIKRGVSICTPIK